MRITDYAITRSGDYVLISQNASQDPTTLKWYRYDVARDAYLIEILDSAANQGYIAFKRANAGGGNISWTEIARMNYDGTLILPALSASIASAAVDQLKMFAKDYSGRTALAKTDNTDEAYLLEGKGLSRVWRQDTQPAGAKLWDVWIDTSGSGVYGLRHGEISVDENTTATTVTVTDTWYQVTVFDTNGPSNDTTPDHTTDDITVDHTGVYFISVSASIRSVAAGGGATFELQCKKNNGATDVGAVHTHRRLSGGGTDVGSISLSGIATLAENDTIEFWLRNRTNTDDIVVESATLSLVEIKQ